MNWEKKEISAELVRDIANRYGCDLLTASILVRRNITSGEEIRYFLESDVRHMRNPFLLPGMEDAVDRILAARKRESGFLYSATGMWTALPVRAFWSDILKNSASMFAGKSPRVTTPTVSL